MEALGREIRNRRQRLGLTLAEVSGRTGISMPYLSLIETGRVSNPPSDEKLQRLEQSLGFGSGDLITPAHLQRTPRDVRVILRQLLSNGKPAEGAKDASSNSAAPQNAADPKSQTDVLHLNKALKDFAGKMDVPLQALAGNAVPVVNPVGGEYPRDFNDLGYPQRVATQFLSCPGITDKDAFAARIGGDAMSPKYDTGDIVIFSPSLPTRNGDDCFVRFSDGQTTFQRVFFDEQANANAAIIRLQPRNEKYPPTFVPSQKIAGIYRAVYCYRRVDGE